MIRTMMLTILFVAGKTFSEHHDSLGMRLKEGDELCSPQPSIEC